MRSIAPTATRTAAVTECRIVAPVIGEPLRRGAGLSLRDVARDIGVSTQTIFRWERGERRPNGDHAVAYLAILRGLENLLDAEDSE